LSAVPKPAAAAMAAKPDSKNARQASNKDPDLFSNRVSVGDTVRVRYLTDDKKVVQFTISTDLSDPATGVIHFKKPIAEALLGAEEGDEVEILVGSYLRHAVLEKIVSRHGRSASGY
jgi:transcription elongation GreA/GreB family factor